MTAAYDVLGDQRLRHSYDEVRVDLPVERVGTAASSSAPTLVRTRPETQRQATPLSPDKLRRRAGKWLAGGIAVTIAGLLVAVVIVNLQVGEHRRRAGRIKTTAEVVIAPTGNQVRFVTAGGEVVQVPEPERVNPGTQHNGQAIDILYRARSPDRRAPRREHDSHATSRSGSSR